MSATTRYQLMREATREGRDARLVGLPQEHNPYRQGPYATKFYAWLSGWHSANERDDAPPIDANAPMPKRSRR